MKIELKTHADTEKRFFYKPLIDHDMTQDKARHGIAEHHEIDELIEESEKTKCSSSAWLKIAKDFQEKVQHHLEDKEDEFFQVAGNVFSASDKEKLAIDYQKHMSLNK